jgi:hypothetical protein
VVRNALIAAGKLEGRAPRAGRRAFCSTTPPRWLRAMAVWALQRLAAPQAWGDAKRRRAEREADPDVRAEWDA